MQFIDEWSVSLHGRTHLLLRGALMTQSCNVPIADTARPPIGLEHLYSQHMHRHHAPEEIAAMEVCATNVVFVTNIALADLGGDVARGVEAC